MLFILRKFIYFPIIATFFSLSTPLLADEYTNIISTSTSFESVITIPEEMKWSRAPNIFPQGAQITILEGDPNKVGAYTIRLKMPANYTLKPHHYLADNHITVLSGSFNVGKGEQFDATKGKLMPSGSFAMIQSNDPIFCWTTSETILQITGVGPWIIQYINTADDPSNPSSSTP